MSPPTLGPEPTSSPSPITPMASASTQSSPSASVPSYSRVGRKDSAKSSFSSISRASSATSIMFSDSEVALVTEDGVKHTKGRLQAKKYKSQDFLEQLLKIVGSICPPTWAASESFTTDEVRVTKVSGSMTNAVFFVSCPKRPNVKTLLLRIYGPSSSELISRPRELHTLHVLSSRYGIGPRVFGTFDNGRLEEFFDSTPLTVAQLRDPTISGWIGARMAELHRVDIEAIEDITTDTRGKNLVWESAACKNVREWLAPAREVLQLVSVNPAYKAVLDFDRFIEEWKIYIDHIIEWERVHGASKRVFAHNDTQYGNLLRLRKVKEGTPEHQQIIVVDFEYASPNSAAFDIANHFHEWTADYHGSTPHLLDRARYPTEEERFNFYRAYLLHTYPSYSSSEIPRTNVCTPGDGSPEAAEPPLHNTMTKSSDGTFGQRHDLRAEAIRLERQVSIWSPASHAMWAVWGLVQAREDLELAAQARATGAPPESPEFDYLAYALCRIEGFRREMGALGLGGRAPAGLREEGMLSSDTYT